MLLERPRDYVFKSNPTMTWLICAQPDIFSSFCDGVQCLWRIKAPMRLHKRKLQHRQTYWTAIDFINNIEDLLLAFSLPLVLIDVSGGEARVREGEGVTEQKKITSIFISIVPKHQKINSFNKPLFVLVVHHGKPWTDPTLLYEVCVCLISVSDECRPSATGQLYHLLYYPLQLYVTPYIQLSCDWFDWKFKDLNKLW